MNNMYLLAWQKRINTMRPRQIACHFADIFKYISSNEYVWMSLKISLKFVPKVRINSIPAQVQIMAWCWPGDNPLSEPMMVSLHISVTRAQWVIQNAWWRDQLETFSALLAICARNSLVTGEFPHTQRPVSRTFDVSFDLRLIKRLSKRWWDWWFETPSRPLWRHVDGLMAREILWIPKRSHTQDSVLLGKCLRLIERNHYEVIVVTIVLMMATAIATVMASMSSWSTL